MSAPVSETRSSASRSGVSVPGVSVPGVSIEPAEPVEPVGPVAGVCHLSAYDWHPECSHLPRYTDGTEVSPGDRVRYRQAPGGLLAASPEWKHGKAVVSSHCSGTLDLAATDGRFYHLLGHIIERV